MERSSKLPGAVIYPEDLLKDALPSWFRPPRSSSAQRHADGVQRGHTANAHKIAINTLPIIRLQRCSSMLLAKPRRFAGSFGGPVTQF